MTLDSPRPGKGGFVSSQASDSAGPLVRRADGVLVVVPAYNEEATVGAVVAGAAALGHAVCVVDDGSTDATAHEASRAGATVVSSARTCGRGRALRLGFAYALRHGYGIVVTVDGDGQHDVRDIATLVARMQASGADLVVGSRFTHPAGPYRIRRARRLAMRLVTARVNAVGRLPLTDSTSGFCAVGRPLIDEFAAHYPGTFLADTAGVLVRTALSGWRIAESPARMEPRGAGRPKTGVVRCLWCLASVLVRIELHRRRNVPAANHLPGPVVAPLPVPVASSGPS